MPSKKQWSPYPGWPLAMAATREPTVQPPVGAHNETRAQVEIGTMADAAIGPQLERAESVPMEIMNKCAYGEPSTKTIMVMGAVAAVLASITVYCIVSWARRSARAKFKAMIKSVFEEVDHDHGGTVDSDELYTAVLLVYLQVST